MYAVCGYFGRNVFVISTRKQLCAVKKRARAVGSLFEPYGFGWPTIHNIERGAHIRVGVAGVNKEP